MGTKNAREWFIYEDQTIGLATVADLINQGYSATDVKQFIRDVEDKSRKVSDEEWDDFYTKYFDIIEGYDLDNFADACEQVKNRR